MNHPLERSPFGVCPKCNHPATVYKRGASVVGVECYGNSERDGCGRYFTERDRERGELVDLSGNLELWYHNPTGGFRHYLEGLPIHCGTGLELRIQADPRLARCPCGDPQYRVEYRCKCSRLNLDARGEPPREWMGCRYETTHKRGSHAPVPVIYFDVPAFGLPKPAGEQVYYHPQAILDEIPWWCRFRWPERH